MGDINIIFNMRAAVIEMLNSAAWHGDCALAHGPHVMMMLLTLDDASPLAYL